ncbi:MAG TPA: TraR/DksA C4-type zinc finger protein [Pyrinomonadaceae bacterium]|jgi:RNA polymerase-binding transcription factor DksA|nr:TraR/DksA C4-type zinc finger protein [Pyrinomonadaceae bacterium]
MDAMLLESVEGLGHSPFVTSPGAIWESLQSERERIGRELLSEGPLCEGETTGLLESEASEEYAREIRWRHRSQLEARLRAITEAQDRVIDGLYGRCMQCGTEIGSKRLLADPAALLCIDCQRSVEEQSALEELRRAIIH